MHDLALLASIALSLIPSPPQQPGGVTWTDFDQDGLKDLLLVTPRGQARLYLSGQGGELTPAPESWGFAQREGVAAAIIADVDADSRADVLLVTDAGGLELQRNIGTGFVSASTGSGLGAVRGIVQASWVDYDEDGAKDLALTDANGNLQLMRNQGELRFARVELDGTVPQSDVRGVVSFSSEDAAATGVVGSDRRASARRERRGGVAPSGSNSAATSGSNVSGVNRAPNRGTIAAFPVCAPGVVDAAGGSCIPASSAPVEGSLYPLTEDLFVDQFGSVGVGTTTPDAELDLQGGTLADLRIGSYSVFAQDYNSAIELGNWDFEEGMRIQSTKSGLDIFSRRLSQGGPFTAGPHLTVLRQDASSVGVGTATPETTLDVDGETTLRDDVHVTDVNDLETITIEPARFVGGGARMTMRNGSGASGLRLDGDLSGGGGLLMYRGNGGASIEMHGEDAGAGYMRFYKPDNSIGVLIDADYGGDARIITEVLEITGGADLVESFDTGELVCEPGMVLVIDETRPGELAPSSKAYDRRVAGVVSGAGGVQPGLHLGQRGTMEGSTQVALTGRVYVRCNAEGGEIRPGDLLTSSSSAGEAMRVSDSERAFGAVLGKAMSGLDPETGLVLVLVGLQ